MTQRDLFNQLVQEPIFIIGAARSGTTWVYDILTAHPEVAGVFESWLFTSNNGLKALFSSAHWPKKHSGLGNTLKRHELLEYTREMAKRVMSHAIEPKHRFLVEKSPSHIFSMTFISEIFPSSKFIHVLRDGRDVSVSVRAAADSWVRPWKDTFGRSIKTSARAWKHAVQRARNDGEKLGDRFFEIRYEEIHKNPSQAYSKLFHFCGIPFDEALLQSIWESTDFTKNYKPRETGFRRGGRIGDWRTRYSIIDSLMFNLEAGKFLVELGYEKNRRWSSRLF